MANYKNEKLSCYMYPYPQLFISLLMLFIEQKPGVQQEAPGASATVQQKADGQGRHRPDHAYGTDVRQHAAHCGCPQAGV